MVCGYLIWQTWDKKYYALNLWTLIRMRLNSVNEIDFSIQFGGRDHPKSCSRTPEVITFGLKFAGTLQRPWDIPILCLLLLENSLMSMYSSSGSELSEVDWANPQECLYRIFFHTCTVIDVFFPDSSLLRYGIPQRWRSHVPYPSSRPVPSGARSVLRSRDHMWSSIPSFEGHHI